MSIHRSVLLREVIENLQPKANERFIDCTVGGGGHAKAILDKTAPHGKILCLDWDKEAVRRAGEFLDGYRERVVLAHSSYTNIKKLAYAKGFVPVSGIVFDLGLSSDQLQHSGRGFSFQVDEPLDMRFDAASNSLTAAHIINEWSEAELVKIFSEYGEERFSKRIAKAIVEKRTEHAIDTTGELVRIIAGSVPKTRATKTHPATRVFQALRIAVNDELNNVRNVLADAVSLLAPGGRLAVISFHSLEDRIVKDFFKQESKGCLCPPEAPICVCGHQPSVKLVTKKPIIPTAEEIAANPRSRSAKLRVVEKLI